VIDPALAAQIRSEPGATVVTAGLRLARAVRRHFALTELDAGVSAWSPPVVMPWAAWLQACWESSLYASGGSATPRLLGSSQLRSVWRDVVVARLGRDARELVNLDALVGACTDAERRLAEWRIDGDVHRRYPMSDDMRFFADCLADYRELQARRRWIALHQVPEYLERHELLAKLDLPERILLAGFDRLTPDQAAFTGALRDHAVDILQTGDTAADEVTSDVRVVSHPTHDDELFAAGAWALETLRANPGARVAIVVPGLAGEARRARRLVSETLLPGWQYRRRLAADEAVRLPEVSFGEPLKSYPAIAIAVELLECAQRAPEFRSISRLLRSALLGADNRRSGPDQELQLRGIPDRAWALADLASWLGERGGEPAWLAAVRRFAGAGALLRPEQWAAAVDVCLAEAGWLAGAPEDSDLFQLRNAWRKALNELGALGDTLGACTVARALLELRQILSATIYQPEGRDAPVAVLGPLEAAGLAFDALCVVGLDAGRWPPAGRPLALLPLQLQRAHDMPDATSADTLRYARQVLGRLCRAAPSVVLSWPRSSGEEVLTVSPLVSERASASREQAAGARYAACDLAGTVALERTTDSVEAITARWRATGGHALLEQQRRNPFEAMVTGRLRCRALEEPPGGPDGRVRGILIHNALSHVYAQQPDSEAMRALAPDRLSALIGAAVEDAARPFFVASDRRLRRLMEAERDRARELIAAFIAADLNRAPFRVIATEQGRTLEIGVLDLRLRLDRVDAVDGQVWIIDYKTGRRIAAAVPARLPETHGQLVTYALTEPDPARLDALLLAAVNRDGAARFVGVAAGDGTAADLEKAVRRVDDLGSLIGDWRAEYERLAGDFATGDIRINAAVPVSDQRHIATLSRLFHELAESGE
jgi:probable DNA repair protein